MNAEILGFVAGALTTLSFVPQVIRVYRNRSGRDVSAWMMLLMVVGTLSWLGYGLMLGAASIVVANIVTCSLAVAILILKLYFSKRE